MEGFLTQTLLIWIKLLVDAKAFLIKLVSLDDLLHLLHVPLFVLQKLNIGIQTFDSVKDKESINKTVYRPVHDVLQPEPSERIAALTFVKHSFATGLQKFST